MTDSTTNCKECPLGNKPSRTVVPPQYPVQGTWNGLVIIGEQPAREEKKELAPFKGNSGKLLNHYLGLVRIPRSACYITNAFHCFHDAAVDMDEKSKIQATKCCRPRLIAELEMMGPRYVLALGGMALKSVTNHFTTRKDDPTGWTASVGDLRGAVLRSSICDLVAPDVQGHVLATVHPAAILRSGGQEADIFHYDLWKMARWLDEGGPHPWVDSHHLAPLCHELEAFLEGLKREVGGAAVDIECVQGIGEERFNRWFDRIRMIGIGWENHAMVIPLLDGEWESYYTREERDRVVAVLKRYLADEDFFTVFHNLQYDVPVLTRYGLEVHGTIHDTMAMHYTLYHMGVKHSLGYAAQQFFDIPPWKEIHGHEHVESSVEDEALYNSRDIRATAMLKGTLEHQLKLDNIWATYLMTVRNHELAWQMSQQGFTVNPSEWKKTLDEWAEKRSIRRAEFLAIAGAGERHVELLKLLRTINLDPLRAIRLNSLQEGLVTPSDVYALKQVVSQAKSMVVQKKSIRELNAAEGALQEVLETPGFAKATEELYTLWKTYERVKTIKKNKAVDQEPLEQQVVANLPEDVVAVFKQVLSEEAEASLDRGKLQELLEKGDALKKPERARLAKLQEAARVAASPLVDPNDLKRVKAASWAEAERPRKELVAPVVQKVRTVANRLVQYSSVVPFLNINADYEVGLAIHGWFDLPVVYPVNSKGDYCVNKEALQHIKGHPLIKAYQSAKLAHDRWDWINKLPIYPDGRVHPVFKPTLKTGRWSSGDSGPEAHHLDVLNAQNMEDIMIHIFKAPEGMKYVGADFSGVELRVGGVLTGCKNLIEQFQRYDAGLDLKVHAQTARRIWKDWAHLPLDEQEKYYQKGKRYKLAKSGGFLTFYGGGPDALAAKVLEMEPYEPDPQKRGVREAEIHQECKVFMQELQTVWPEVFTVRERWYQEAKRSGRLKIGYLTNRYMRFPIQDEDHISMTLCANAPVQCTAGEISHFALDKLSRHLPSTAKIILYVHDQIVVECPESIVENVSDIMRTCMEYYIEGPAGGLLCRADPVIGDTLRDLHKD